MGLTIWCNAKFNETAEWLLADGTKGHRLIYAADRDASVLAMGKEDPALASADVAFGQPDAAQPRLDIADADIEVLAQARLGDGAGGNDDQIGGADVHILPLARDLMRLGHQMTKGERLQLLNTRQNVNVDRPDHHAPPGHVLPERRPRATWLKDD